jgi:hypothetical protein
MSVLNLDAYRPDAELRMRRWRAGRFKARGVRISGPVIH